LVVYLLGRPRRCRSPVCRSRVVLGIPADLALGSRCEVYRAGIEPCTANPRGAALGLRWQTLRYVVIPQAVRRVIPPLMNDFIALQKDTALIAVVSGTLPEAFLMGRSTRPVISTSADPGRCAVLLVITTDDASPTGSSSDNRRRQAGATGETGWRRDRRVEGHKSFEKSRC
jgi:hypothetical protein